METHIKENGVFDKLQELSVIKAKLQESQYDEVLVSEMALKAENALIGKFVTVEGIYGRIIDVQLMAGYFVLFEAEGDEVNHHIKLEDL